MKGSHRLTRSLTVNKTPAAVVHRRKLLATAVSLALAGTSAFAAQWGPNLEVFGRFSDDRVVGGFELLAPVWQNNYSLAFAELKANASDGQSQEFNVGLGYRQLTADESWIFGGFASYDRRSTGYGNNFDQLTVGAEAFGRMFDVRLNYCMPPSPTTSA
jgi:opacity protein-like surface antigen